jgi:hypothetical protein
LINQEVRLSHLICQKKKFDSADYFQEHENLKQAAGLAEGKHSEEEKKN